MAITVGIFAESGQGKTTSLVVNPDGTISLDDLVKGTKETYQGMDPSSTVLLMLIERVYLSQNQKLMVG